MPTRKVKAPILLLDFIKREVRHISQEELARMMAEQEKRGVKATSEGLPPHANP